MGRGVGCGPLRLPLQRHVSEEDMSLNTDQITAKFATDVHGTQRTSTTLSGGQHVHKTSQSIGRF